MILAEYTFHMNSADIFGFLHKIIIPDVIRHDSHIKDNTFTAKLCTGNILGPFQINYITVVLKVIEFPSPVRSYHQDINIILNDVIDLLSLIFFNDDLICQPRPSHILDSLNEAVPHIEFAPLNVKALTCDTYDQIITKCFCSFDNIVVAFMKKIKSAICDYSLHSFVITPLKKIFLFCRTVFLLHTLLFTTFTVTSIR